LNDSAATKRLDLLIVLGAVLAVLLVDPRGDFPLSDDWSYAHSARVLCESGRIEFLPWTGASLLFQAGYGALLCKVAGFSFTILRLSTIVLAAVGAIAFSHLLATLAIGPKTSRLAVATLALGPLYFSQSFTFMTDVPFAALTLAAAALYAAGLAKTERRLLLAASLLASAALLVRQHGAFLVAAAAFATLVVDETRLRKRVELFAATSVIPALVFIGFHYWLFWMQGVPAGLQNKVTETSIALGIATVDHAFRAAATLALAVLPIIVLTGGAVLIERRRALACVSALFGLGAILVYVRDGSTMFYLPNVQYDFGLGALTLRDTLFLGLDPPRTLGSIFSIPLTLVSLSAAATFGAAATGWTTRLTKPCEAFVLFAFAGMFLGSLLHGGFYFDRYLIPVIPFAIAALLLGRREDTMPPLALALAALVSVYAVAGTHDYLAMNRARHDLLRDVEKRGIGIERIDGGFEYNAWRSAASAGVWPTKESARRGQAADTKSWWWVTDDEYVVSGSELDGYTTVDKRAYAMWLTLEPAEILLLERNPPP
jgi:4-amino-4-deoxy-L-arabinose transferase-like glycosyltransferase